MATSEVTLKSLETENPNQVNLADHMLSGESESISENVVSESTEITRQVAVEELQSATVKVNAFRSAGRTLSIAKIFGDVVTSSRNSSAQSGNSCTGTGTDIGKLLVFAYFL